MKPATEEATRVLAEKMQRIIPEGTLSKYGIRSLGWPSRSRLIARLDFRDTESLIAFFVEKVPDFYRERVATKVVGKTLLVIEKGLD